MNGFFVRSIKLSNRRSLLSVKLDPLSMIKYVYRLSFFSSSVVVFLQKMKFYRKLTWLPLYVWPSKYVTCFLFFFFFFLIKCSILSFWVLRIMTWGKGFTMKNQFIYRVACKDVWWFRCFLENCNTFGCI